MLGLAFVYYYPRFTILHPDWLRERRDNGPMPAPQKGGKALQDQAIPGTLDALAEAVESGAGLPAVARAAAQVLDASVALIDRSSSVLAVAGASPTRRRS